MSHPHGTYLGGIRTLEDVRQRCRIDEDTGCWLWSMNTCEGHPRLSLRDAQTGVAFKTTGPAGVVYLRTGERVPTGLRAYRKCCVNLCVAPDHILVGTRDEHGTHVASMGVWKNSQTRIAANTKTSRTRAGTKMNMDKAREVRASGLTEKQLAAIYDVPMSTIGSIRRGKLWRETRQMASVFSWGGGA